MANTTSGTTTFDKTFAIDEILEEAYERIGLQNVSGNQLRMARRSLNIMFQEWGNRGLHYWEVANNSFTLVDGQAVYTMFRSTGDGTSDATAVYGVDDVLEAVYRNASSVDTIILNTNGNTYFNGGNVGIGTTSPYNKLHVNGTGRINSLIVGDASASNTPAVALHIKSSATNARLRIEDSDSSNDYWDFYVNQGDGLYFIEDGANRVTFKTGGNVGIGNTNPPSTLTVNGTIALYDSAADPNLTINESGVSRMGAGEINIVQGWSGTLTAGDTLVFTYNKVSWAAYGFEIEGTNAGRWGKIEGGGYSNGGPGLQSYTNVGNLFSSFAITSTSGNNQGLVMTMTLAGGIHTVFRIRYFQGGGDSVPLASRATLDLNS